MGLERSMVTRTCQKDPALAEAIRRCEPDGPGFEVARELWAKARATSRKLATDGVGRQGDLAEQLLRARIAQTEADAGLKAQRLAQKAADLWPGEVVGDCIRTTIGAIADALRDVPSKIGLMVPPEVRADVEDKTARLIRQTLTAATDAARQENLRAMALAAAESAEVADADTAEPEDE